MRILIYASDQKQLERLTGPAGVCFPGCCLELFRDVTALQLRLRRNLRCPGVFLLLVANLRELEGIVHLASLMDGQRIILVLPDRDRKTVVLGHSLYPRFIGYADDDFQEVRMVMAQLIEHLKKQNRRN